MDHNQISLFSEQAGTIVKKVSLQDDVVGDSQKGSIPVVRLVVVLNQGVVERNGQLDSIRVQFIDWVSKKGFYVRSSANGYSEVEKTFTVLLTVETTQKLLRAAFPSLQSSDSESYKAIGE